MYNDFSITNYKMRVYIWQKCRKTARLRNNAALLLMVAELQPKLLPKVIDGNFKSRTNDKLTKSSFKESIFLFKFAIVSK